MFRIDTREMMRPGKIVEALGHQILVESTNVCTEIGWLFLNVNKNMTSLRGQANSTKMTSLRGEANSTGMSPDQICKQTFLSTNIGKYPELLGKG